MKTSDFYTVPRAEEGFRVPLLKADGRDSGEWIHVLGADSRAYAKAESEMFTAFAKVPKDWTWEKREEASGELIMQFHCAIITDWSFTDEPFNEANLRAFLKLAPRVANEVASAAKDPKNFLGPGSTTSTAGQPSNTASAAAAGHSSASGSGSARTSRRKNSATSSTTGGNSARGTSATPKLPAGPPPPGVS